MHVTFANVPDTNQQSADSTMAIATTEVGDGVIFAKTQVMIQVIAAG